MPPSPALLWQCQATFATPRSVISRAHTAQLGMLCCQRHPSEATQGIVGGERGDVLHRASSGQESRLVSRSDALPGCQPFIQLPGWAAGTCDGLSSQSNQLGGRPWGRQSWLRDHRWQLGFPSSFLSRVWLWWGSWRRAWGT